MRSESGVAAVALGLVLLAGPARADVYTWVDKEGTVHFQEEPPGNGVTARRLQTPAEGPTRAEAPRGDAAPPRGDTAPPRGYAALPRGDAAMPQGDTAPPRIAATPQGGPPSAPVPARPAVKPRPAPVVDLFTTSWCPWCQKARDYFSSRGIRFTEHDIDNDADALRRKVGIDGDRRVPTAVIDGKVIRGFSPPAYQAALERR